MKHARRTFAIVAFLGLLACVAAFAQDAGPAAGDIKIAPKVDMTKVSYLIGMNIGRTMKMQGIDVVKKDFLEGLESGLKGEEPKMTPEEIQKVMTDFQEYMTAKQEEVEQNVATENKAKGAAFLDANKNKEGVKVTNTGLQYKVVQEGAGAKPTAADTVTVQYKGTLIDGTEFDSSYKRGRPATFPLGGVIPGWTEGMQLMKEGGKLILFVPSELAYGERGTPNGPIGPNAVLVFEIELVKVQKGEEAMPKP